MKLILYYYYCYGSHKLSVTFLIQVYDNNFSRCPTDAGVVTQRPVVGQQPSAVRCRPGQGDLGAVGRASGRS